MMIIVMNSETLDYIKLDKKWDIKLDKNYISRRTKKEFFKESLVEMKNSDSFSDKFVIYQFNCLTWRISKLN
jgi:hypothetical protein